MAFHARSLAALGSTRGLRHDAFSNISKFFAMTPVGIEDRWWKLLSKPVVGSKCTGSFDCVRLAPHFAQDDKFGMRRRVRGITREKQVLCFAQDGNWRCAGARARVPPRYIKAH